MSRSDRIYLALSLIVGAAGAGLLVAMGHHPNDDAYITFRHSRLFAEMGRLAWNPAGQPEMGSTAPLFALILGILGFVFGAENIPRVSLYLNAVLLTVMGPLFYRIGLDLTARRPAALAIAALSVLSSYNIRIYSQGFEAALFVVLLFSGFALIVRGRFTAAAVIAGLLPFVRPEGVWLSVPLFAALLLRRGFSIRTLSLYAVWPLFWIVFSLAWYGQVMPQSVASKKIQMELGMNLITPVSGWARVETGFVVLQGLWDMLLKPVLLYTVEPGVFTLPDIGKPGNSFLKGNLALAIAAAFLVIVLRKVRTRPLEVSYISYIPFFLLFVLYTLRLEFWYLPVWNISVYLTLAAGFTIGLDWAFSRWKSPWAARIVTALAIGFAGLLIAKNTFVLNRGTRPFDAMRGPLYAPAERDSVEFERFLGYKRAAERINALGPGSVIANEIGTFGFYYQGEVIDLFGLSTQKPLDIYLKVRQSGRKTDPVFAVVEELKPDYIMGGFVSSLLSVPDQARFIKENYTFVYADPDYRVFGSTLEVWKKK